MNDDWVYRPPEGAPVVLYEDRDVVVVNKPAGLLSVPGRGALLADCAESRLSGLFGKIYAAHRLDMDTSGLLIFARRRSAERELHRQFRERLVEKRYVARVAGILSAIEGVISQPLRVIDGEGRSAVDPQGKPAHTRFVVQRQDENTALLHLFPRTGRSHQLRVHLAFLGHPILGDRFYAPPDVAAQSARLLLHAEEICFHQPYSGAAVRVIAAAPFD